MLNVEQSKSLFLALQPLTFDGSTLPLAKQSGHYVENNGKPKAFNLSTFDPETDG
jgi:hypothetical protein